MELAELLREPLRNGHSAREVRAGDGVRTLSLTAVTTRSFSEENTKLTEAVPDAVKDLWLRAGDILIQRSNTPELVGSAALYSGPEDFAIFPDLLIRVRVSAEVSPRFVDAFLQSTVARSYFRGRAQGIAGSMPKISQGTIEALALPFPPIQEQRRLTEAIDSYLTRLDAAAANLERAQAKLKAYRASVLKAAVEGRLVPTEAELARRENRDYEPADVLLARILKERRRRWEKAELARLTANGTTPNDDKWKAKYEEPSPPDPSAPLALPEGWCWSTVEQICSAIVDCPHSTPKWTDVGRVCVRTTEFRPGRLDLDGHRCVAEGTYLERIKRLQPVAGDVLYSREGGILGVACQVPDGVDLCLGQRMMLMRAESGLGQYLMHVLNSPLTLRIVRRLTGGSAAPHVNVGDVRKFPIPLAPRAEVQRIVEEIDHLSSIADERESHGIRTALRLRRLRQAILKWAFEGKLVDQDPADEPAEELLARIRAEREAASTTKTPPKPRGRNRKSPR